MFNQILNEYNTINNEINLIFSDISLEANIVAVNNSTNINDEENKVQRGNVFADKIKAIIDKLLAMIERAILTIKHMYEKVLLTDKGFKKELRDAEINRKPLNGIKLITYPYIPEVLNGVNARFKRILTNTVSSATITNNSGTNIPLLMDKDEFVNYVFKELGAPENIRDMDIYFKYIREKFRGTKSEKTIMADSLSTHKKIVESYGDLQLSLNRDLAAFKAKINEINTTLKTASKNPNVIDEEKKKLISKIHNLSILYNMYSNYCRIHMELRVEQMLNSRIIIKRLYQL